MYVLEFQWLIAKLAANLLLSLFTALLLRFSYDLRVLFQCVLFYCDIKLFSLTNLVFVKYIFINELVCLSYCMCISCAVLCRALFSGVNNFCMAWYLVHFPSRADGFNPRLFH